MRTPLFALHCAFSLTATLAAATPGLSSIDTGYTIAKVRTAQVTRGTYIVASSYEGTVMGISYPGTFGWKNELSGFMNHDLWCEDITGDGMDEVLAANADGTVYCLNSKGELQWQFQPNQAPMNAVCVVHHEKKPYVVCGGYDNRIYYLSPTGELIKEIPSSNYSKEKSWGKGYKPIPPKFLHTANFLRGIRQPDGTDVLVVHGALNSNSGRGSVYLLRPLEDTAFETIKIEHGGSVGELRIGDPDHDGNQEILLGASSMIDDAAVVLLDIDDAVQNAFLPSTLRRQIDGFGYRVAQGEFISDGGSDRLFILFGSRILLVPPSLDAGETEVLTCKYSFNDMWKDSANNKIILASSQSGGSCIHVLDLGNENWKQAYENLTPPGKIAAILENTAATRNRLQQFKRPAGEREPLPVYLMTENTDSVADLVDELKKYNSPLFLGGKHLPRVEHWDRSSMQNVVYQEKRDGRKKYVLTSDEMVAELLPEFEDAPGIAYWGGHGNDPYQISLPTEKKIIAAANGKKTVMIYPELEQHDENFAFCLNDLIYPLADYCQGKNANIYVRTKHTFWQSIAYMPLWSRLLSGEFADVFVPSMEETTDKSMELSVAARSGI